MSRKERLAAHEREDVQARESLDLTFGLKNAGGYHKYACVPSGKCRCERATTTRKAS